MALNTYTLTIDLVNIHASGVEGINVGVNLVDPSLIYPIIESSSDTETETLYPTSHSAATNAMGIAMVQLMPSQDDGDQPGVGNYTVTIGSYTRVITMPAENARLADIGEAVPATVTGLTTMDIRLARLVSTLSDSEKSSIQTKLGIDDLSGGSGGTSLLYSTFFPNSPESGTWFVFSEDVPSGLNWKDIDGSTDLTAADKGDTARYNGTDWVKIGSLVADVGPRGPAGADGADGATGPRGLQGVTGDKGDKGDKGDTGDTGPAGPTGPTGPTGPAGADGADGNDGATGPRGLQGVTGDKGDKGDKGDTGDTGPAGSGSNVPDKPSTPSSDTEYNLKITDTGVATWEEDTGGGGTYTLTQATEDTLGGVQGADATQASAASGTTILGWSNNRLRALVTAALPTVSATDASTGTSTGRRAWTAERVRSAANAAITALVPAVFRQGNTDLIATSKLGSGTRDGTTYLKGDGTFATGPTPAEGGPLNAIALVQVGNTVNFSSSAAVTGPAFSDLSDVFWVSFVYTRSPNSLLRFNTLLRKAEIEGVAVASAYRVQLQGGGGAFIGAYDDGSGNLTFTALDSAYSAGACDIYKLTGSEDGITMTAGDARYLQLSGGTLTGLLTLSGAPTADLHAATKKYVDDNAGGGGSNVPNSPAAESAVTKYVLNIATDGTASWVEAAAGGGTTVTANPAGSADGGDLTKIDVGGTIYSIPEGSGGTGGTGGGAFATEIGRGNIDIDTVREWTDTGIDIPDSVGDDEWWGVQILGETHDPIHIFEASEVVGSANVTAGSVASNSISGFHSLAGFVFEAFSGSADHTTRLGRTAAGDIVIASASVLLDPMPLVLWRINAGGGTAVEANPSEAADGGDLTKIEIGGTVYDIAAGGGSGGSGEPTTLFADASYQTRDADTWYSMTLTRAPAENTLLEFYIRAERNFYAVNGSIGPNSYVFPANRMLALDTITKGSEPSSTDNYISAGGQRNDEIFMTYISGLWNTEFMLCRYSDTEWGIRSDNASALGLITLNELSLGGGGGDTTAIEGELDEIEASLDRLDVPEVVGDFEDADADDLAAGYGVYPSADGTFSDSDFVLSGTTPAAGTNRFLIRTPKHASRYGARIVLNTTPAQTLPDNDPLAQERLVKVASRPSDAQDGYDYFYVGFLHDDAPIQDANVNTYKLQVAPVTQQEIINIGYWQDSNQSPNVAPTSKSIATVRAGELFPIVFPAKNRPRNLHFALAAGYDITALYIAGSSVLTDFSKVAESRLANFWHSARIRNQDEISCLIKIERA